MRYWSNKKVKFPAFSGEAWRNFCCFPWRRKSCLSVSEFFFFRKKVKILASEREPRIFFVSFLLFVQKKWKAPRLERDDHLLTQKFCLPLMKGGRGMFHRTCDAMRTEHPPSPLHKGEVKVSSSILLPKRIIQNNRYRYNSGIVTLK